MAELSLVYNNAQLYTTNADRLLKAPLLAPDFVIIFAQTYLLQ